MVLSSWFRRAVLGVGLGLIVVACGDDDDGGGGGATSGRTALIQEICDGLNDCCKASGKANETSSCVAFYTVFTASQTYNAAKGQECLASIKAARQSGALCGSDDGVDGTSNSACEGAFTDPSGSGGSSSGGSKQPGTACSDSSECAKVSGADDVYCTTSTTFNPDGTSTSEKYCEVTIAAKVGDTCEDDKKGYSYSCDSDKGDSCDFSTKKCVAAKTEGQDCSGASCASGLYCQYANATSTCAKKLAAGASCKDSSQACSDETYCNDSKVCTTALAAGAACTTSNQCASHYCVNGACDKGSSGGSSGNLCFTKDSN